MDDIIQIAKKLAFSMISLIAIIKCISFIHMPPNVLPSNLFALSSYIDTFNLNADILLNRLDYGIRGIGKGCVKMAKVTLKGIKRFILGI